MQELTAETAAFDTQFGSKQEEAAQLRRQLKALYSTYEAKKSERAGLREQFQARVLAPAVEQLAHVV